MNEFLDVMKKRRSQYSLNKEIRCDEEAIIELVRNASLYAPTAFNMQSARVMILFNSQHDRLWDITMDRLRRIVPSKSFGSTKEKIESFRAAYGTILFFDDTSVTNEYADKFVTYRDNFGAWAQQGNGILQFSIWSMLSELGLGASLQHYNPLIDEEVAKAFDVPKSWQLIAEMPFGNIVEDPQEKVFDPLDQRVFLKK